MKAILFSLLSVAAITAACGGPPPDSLLGWDNMQKEPLDDGGTTSTTTGGGGGGGGGSTGGGGGSTAGGSGTTAGATGVPCDVATVFASKCTGCHSDPPVNGSLSGLVTYADLTAKSTEDPAKTLVEESVIRMQSTSSPMPPASLSNPATASDISTLQNWINAGMPQGECDGGVIGGGGATAVFSGQGAYTQKAGPSGEHNAGRDCLSCHDGSGEAPHFVFAGTLYNGSGSPVAGAEIRVVDGNGNAVSVYSASNGNFYQRASGNFVTPGHAGVRNATTTNLMVSNVTNGGCNSCHCSGSSCATTPLHLP